MPVYVDPLMNCVPNKQWRWTQSCHLLADTLEELHEFADKLGMKRAWFQDHRTPHYDLTDRRRAKAVRLGAIEIRHDKEFGALLKRIRESCGNRDENSKSNNV